MNCPNCSAANEPGRKFCGQCGARLAIVCASCGSANTPGLKFCGECGSALGEAAGPALADSAIRQPDAPPAVAERRLVSVVFADLVGFTTISEARDPETIRELLGRYFENASAIVDRYGGTIEKFIGDAVMAVWGTPTAHEDDAERAVRAALDLVEGVRHLGDELGLELQLRAGVLTGETAVTVGAANQGMVAGDLVNTASRLQSVAPPGTVLVGEATRQAAAGAITFEPAGEHELKGKAAPVTAYRAMRVVARRGGAGRSEQLEAPFVGRQAELRTLKDFHTATGAEGRPRLVSIMGQGGIGKSRLVWEFQKYLDGVTEVAYWHYGRSPAYGEGVTFWALAEMVRGRAGILEGEEPATVRQKLSAALNEFVTDDAERDWIEPRLLHLLGVEDPGGAVGEMESLLAARRIFFERIAEHGTVVLVFEDLQWADGGLLDFIEHLLDWSRDRPIYLITLARPELLDRRATWGAGRHNFTSLVLEPLPEAAMRELMQGLLPGMSDALVARIVDRSEGIPLYAVETVRMLLDEGRIERDGERYRLVGDDAELSVPASLHALIAARLDALDPADRALLQAASVVGKTFSAAALAEISGEELTLLTARLRALVRRELLTLEADPRSPEQGQYGFVQGLIREVTYGGLAKGDRRRLHLAAARYFETLDDEGIAAVLAEHYLAAYRAKAQGAEGDAVAAQARVALRAAAERAMSLGSHGQARVYFEQALEVTGDPIERAQLHRAAGGAGSQSAPRDDAAMISHFKAALEITRQTGDRGRILEATTNLAAATSWTGRTQEAVALMQTALEEFADLDGTAEWVAFIAELARSEMLLDHPEEALARTEQVLPLAERLELTHETLELVVTRGSLLAGSRRPAEAIVVLLGALSRARSLQIPHLELRAATNLSYAAAGEDPRLSYTVAREGLEFARHLGRRAEGSYLRANALEAAIRVGDWDWAISQIAEAFADDPDGDFGALTAAARIAAFRGEEAAALIAKAEAWLHEVSEVQAFAALDVTRSDAAFADGRHAEARRLAVDSMRRKDAPDSVARARSGLLAVWLADGPAVARSLSELAEVPGKINRVTEVELSAGLAAIEGRTHDALIGYRGAAARWRELGLEFDLALCQLTMVRALGTTSPEAREAAAEARGILTRLGAKALLAHLDEAEGASPATSAGTPESGAGERPAAAVHGS